MAVGEFMNYVEKISESLKKGLLEYESRIRAEERSKTLELLRSNQLSLLDYFGPKECADWLENYWEEQN
jgi:hypothetical protein